MVLTLVMTMLKRMMNFWLYSGPIERPPISERHLRVTFRNSGTSRNYRSGVGVSEDMGNNKKRGWLDVRE